jgi:hypothetical protein
MALLLFINATEISPSSSSFFMAVATEDFFLRSSVCTHCLLCVRIKGVEFQCVGQITYIAFIIHKPVNKILEHEIPKQLSK